MLHKVTCTREYTKGKWHYLRAFNDFCSLCSTLFDQFSTECNAVTNTNKRWQHNNNNRASRYSDHHLFCRKRVCRAMKLVDNESTMRAGCR